MVDRDVPPPGTHVTAASFAVRDAARLGSSNAEALAAFALRSRSHGAREVLARAASKGALNHRTLLEAVVADADPGLDALWTAWTAYVEACGGPLSASVGGSCCDPQRHPDTTQHLLGRAAALTGGVGLPVKVADVRAQYLLRTGRREEARIALEATPVSAHTRWEIECDLANPHLWPGEDVDPRRWTELLNRPFARGGVEPVAVASTSAPAFDGLSAAAPRLDPAQMEAMVSVVMSAYRPDRGILAAARSILDQTWSHLELLVIDDASPPGSESLLSEVAALDPRVRLIRADANEGTYMVRNLAFREARGDFITFQDSDDWSHPRRLEVQVRALLRDPALLATRTPAIRAYPDLSLTWPGYPAQRPNASSLLFRRREVHDLIGDFDAVRKSADMEYPRRLQALRPGSIRDVDEHGPMAVTQLRGDSLSRTDAVPGWIRWTRLSYQDAYLEWHERIRHGSADPRLRSDGPRPFPVPDPTWSPWRTSAEIPRERFDVVFLGDWRSGRSPNRQLLDEMRLLASNGLRVGIAHVEAMFPLAPRRQARARPVQRLINVGVVELTHLERASDVGLLLVAHPDVLTYLPDVPVGLVTRGVLAVADDETALIDVASADLAARGAFGVSPRWTARHPRLLAALRSSWPGVTVEAEALPYGIDARALRVSDRRLLGPEPVIGHHLPDEPARWPSDRAQLLAAYPPVGADVRLLHGTSAAVHILGKSSHPVGWLSFDGTDVQTRAFLSRLDFFVYLGVRDHVADHALLEAMAAGCLPVVTEDFEDLAGEGAVYVPRGAGRHAAAEVARLIDDPDAFRRRQALAREVLGRTRVLDRFVDRVRGLMESPAPPCHRR